MADANANAPTIDPGARRVINNHLGLDNIASMDTSKDDILHVLKKCIDILKDHCGPLSSYAMVTEAFSSGESFRPSLFTRDGARVLGSVEFMSPLEKFIQEMLVYVGTRVDSHAKDGTTTSMLVTASFLYRLLTMKPQIDALGLSIVQMEALMSDMLKNIEKRVYDQFTWTINRVCGIPDDQEVPEPQAIAAAADVAFAQALSSSGGNIEIANIMRSIYAHSPRVAWDFMNYHTSIKDNGEYFSMDVPEYDARVRCVAATQNILNSALNTEYEAENVLCIVVPNSMDGGAFIVEQVQAYITEEAEKDEHRPILLLSKNLDGRFIAEMAKLNNIRAEKIAIWNYSPEYSVAGQDYPWELMTLAAIAGIEPATFNETHDFDPEKGVFTAAKVHWHDTYLDFYGIIPDQEEGECLHPFYKHPEKATKFYQDTVDQVKVMIKQYRDGLRPDGKAYNTFIEILNNIACIHRPTLRLGGPIHEQMTNKEICQDVQGAIMSALNSGFVVNGAFPLWISCGVEGSMLGKHDYTPDSPEGKFITLVGNALTTAVQDVIVTVYGFKDGITWTQPQMQAMSTMAGAYANAMDPDKQVRTFETFMTKASNNEDILKEYRLTYPVCQPFTITKELLKRIKELAIKFISTSKIITMGGVMMSEEQKAKMDKLNEPTVVNGDH